ncbi:MAG TPA: type IVB secretion system protein IcmH/DotU [Pyrinomonadaceae bacterium]|nr:type IVB secretion system protein IcmH/DotU [Pyrinomonadaceae bacterium]
MSAVAENPQVASRRRARSSNDLVSLAGPVFELLLKLQAGLVEPSNELRPAIKRLLDDFEQRGTTLRYGQNQIQSAKFALAAFADETMLSAAFPLREEWEKFPLQLEYFREHLAGVKFFEKLDELLKNAEQEADVIEVYYVCMLLGLKGKYKIYMEDQLKGVMEATAHELRRVGRLQETDLSPHWKVADQPPPPPKRGIPLWMKISAGVLLVFVFLVFVVLSLLLTSDLNAAKEQLLR